MVLMDCDLNYVISNDEFSSTLLAPMDVGRTNTYVYFGRRCQEGFRLTLFVSALLSNDVNFMR